MRPVRWRPVLLTLGAWTVPALLASLQVYLQLSDRGLTARWLPLFFNQMAVWYPWAAFTPFILAFARRFPLDRSSWVTSVPRILAATAIIVLAYSMVFTAIALPLEGRPLTLGTWVAGLGGSVVARLTNHILLVWAVAGIGYALEYQRRYRDRLAHAARLESQLAQAQLETLRMQLHPHFLFNSLNTVSALVRSGDQRTAVRMITALSDLLRFSLDRLRVPEVPLHEELEGLDRFLEIAELRFEDRLHVERSVAPETADLLVPPFLLQPIVENSLRHGLEADAGAGLIRIEAARVGHRLVLRVEDDGPGPGADDNRGVGMSTTRARLETLYGDRAAVTLERREPRGARVTITLPVARAPAGRERSA